jgi:hypothetical protein
MTCIAGLVDNGKVYLGGDAAAVSGNMIQGAANPKVFRKGEFILGYTTSFRMGQILEHEFEPPIPTPGNAYMEYMVTKFALEVKKTLTRCGYVMNAQEGGGFLVGYDGKLYRINTDYQVFQSVDGFDSVGCGSPEALASMYSSEGLLTDPQTRVRLALEASAHFNTGVRPPFTILSLG